MINFNEFEGNISQDGQEIVQSVLLSDLLISYEVYANINQIHFIKNYNHKLNLNSISYITFRWKLTSIFFEATRYTGKSSIKNVNLKDSCVLLVI